MEISFSERGEKREGWRWRWRQTGRRRDRKRELTEIDKGAQRVEVLRERKKERVEEGKEEGKEMEW